MKFFHLPVTSFEDVTHDLEQLQTGGVFSGTTAGGDLSGTYPSPTVAALQGHAVSSTAPTTNKGLVWTGSAWTPTTVLQAANNLSDVASVTTARTNLNLGSAARGHRSGALSAATGNTAVGIDAVDFDAASSFSGGVYVTPRSGIYLCLGQVRAGLNNNPQQLQALITGGTGASGELITIRGGTVSDPYSVVVGALISASASASIGLSVFNNGGNSVTVDTSGQTYLSVIQVA